MQSFVCYVFVCGDGGGAPAPLIKGSLYVNPKASVVVNLGEEAKILLCHTRLLKWNTMTMLIVVIVGSK